MSRDRARLLGAYVVALGVGVGCARALPGDLSPLLRTLLADIAATVTIFLLGLPVRNASLYDPYWSVAPIAIALIWLVTAPVLPGLTAILTVLVVALWGVRLTLNFLAGWGGLAHEDWRYQQIRAQTGGLFPLVSLAGIHLFPTLMVFGGLLPVWYLVGVPGAAFTPGVLLGLAVSAGGTALEATADHQLRRFRRRRHDPQQILAEGVWALCRHPNYLGEMLVWWGLWLAAAFAHPPALWTGIGALAITVMFQVVSVPLIDRRMLQRRPRYAELVARIGAILPRG